MAINVTHDTGDTNKIRECNRVTVRTSGGRPYVVVENLSDTSIDVYKGDGVVPTDFTEQDVTNNPSANVYGSASAAIDSNDIIHIVYMEDDEKSSNLLYIQFDTGDDTFKNGAEIVDDLQADIIDLTQGHTSIAIDSNDVPHVAFRNDEKSDDWTINYINNVDSVWNGGDWYEVEGETNGVNCRYPDIAIDADDKPCISYWNSTDADLGTAQGNANDATTFTLFDVDNSNNSAFTSIVVDSSGNHWLAFSGTANNDLMIRKHVYGVAWTTWVAADIVDDISSTGNSFTGAGISLVVDGTDRYIFAEEMGSSDIEYWYETGGGWTWGGALETGTYEYPRAKWGFWVDNDSTGAISNTNVYYVDDPTPTDADSAWTDDGNAFDGSTSTYAYNTNGFSAADRLVGNESTYPEVGVVKQVRVRIYAGFDTTGGLDRVRCEVFSDAEDLGGALSQQGQNGWGDWGTATPPTGGWTKTNLAALEYRISVSGQNVASEWRIYKTEIEVTSFVSGSRTELDYVFSDGTDIHWNTLSLAAGTPVTVNPAVQTITTSLPQETVTTVKNITQSPSVQDITLSLPQETVTPVKNITTSPATQTITALVPAYALTVVGYPATQTITASVPTPYVISTSVTVSISVQDVTTSLPGRTIAVGDGATPAVQTLTLSVPVYTVTPVKNTTQSPAQQDLTLLIPTYTVSISDTVSPTVQITVLSIPAYTVTTGIKVNANTQTLTLSIPSRTISVGDGATPATQTLSVSIPAYTVTPVKNVTINANVQELTTSIPTYTIVQIINVNTQTLTTSIPTYSLSLGTATSPSVQTLTVSVPSRTILIGDGATPATQTVTLSIPTYTVTTVKNTTQSPSVQDVTLSIPTYSVSGDADVSSSEQVLALSIPTYIVTVDEIIPYTFNASTQLLTLSIPAYTVTAIKNVTINAGVQNLTLSIPTYSVSIADTVTPSESSLVATIPIYAVSYGVTISISTQTLAASLPSRTIAVGDGATPATQSLSASIPVYTVTPVKNVTFSAAVLDLTLSIPAYVVTASGDITINIAAQDLTLSIPTYSVTAIKNVTVSAPVQDIILSVPAYTVSISDEAAPTESSLTVSIPTYTVTGDANVTGTLQELTASIPIYDVSISEELVPSESSLTVTIPTYTVTAVQNVTVSASVQDVAVSIPAYLVSISDETAPTESSLTTSIPTYTVTTVWNVTVNAAVQVVAASVPTYAVSVSEGLAPSESSLTVTIPAYTVTAVKNVTASPSVQTVTASIPTYSVTTVFNVEVSAAVLDVTASIPTYTVIVPTHVTINARVQQIGPYAMIYDTDGNPYKRVTKKFYIPV